MITSVRWLNRYLEPGNVTADEADHVLTHVGFPIEGREDIADGDIALDVELTSNRGDCLAHVGLAREVAAATGRRLVLPGTGPSAGGPPVESLTSVDNQVGALCPRFTARVIQGVRVGPSPAWLVRALESIGQRSINNVVDVSNFVLFELGHPSHTFDMGRLAERRLVVRHARDGEEVVGLDDRTHRLIESDLVVADAERAVSLAGVIGGRQTGVTGETTDVLLEVATWDPVAIRHTARRLGISTDAGYRFERFVDPRDIPMASDRCAELILEVAGGRLAHGMIDEGAASAPKRVVELRIDRCEHMLGIEVPEAEVTRLLDSIGIRIAGGSGAGVLRCEIPHHRHDVMREADLIEEVGRLRGFDALEVGGAVEIRLDIPHPSSWDARERAMTSLGGVLTGMGFYETVTVSFLPEAQARMFQPPGLRLLKVDEDRRKETPYLRPSVIPSLLTCRRANQDGRVELLGGVRLFETASVFAEEDGPPEARATCEDRVLALLVDAGTKADDAQSAVRLVRGALEGVARTLGGGAVEIGVEPAGAVSAGVSGDACARVLLGGEAIGWMGLASTDALRAWELETPVAVAEVRLGPLVALYPPAASAEPLPAFPGITRDVSLIVDEGIAWKQVEELLGGMRLALLEGNELVGVFRGRQIGAGKKSVTIRLRFGDPTRTLRHEEVDPQVGEFIRACTERLGAELRT